MSQHTTITDQRIEDVAATIQQASREGDVTVVDLGPLTYYVTSVYRVTTGIMMVTSAGDIRLTPDQFLQVEEQI